MQNKGCPQGGSVIPSHVPSERVNLSGLPCAVTHRSSHLTFFQTHHYAGVELVEALHGAIAEAVTQVFLDKVGMVQDVISHQWLLSSEDKLR